MKRCNNPGWTNANAGVKGGMMFKRTVQVWGIRVKMNGTVMLAQDYITPYSPARSMEIMYILSESKKGVKRLLKSGKGFSPHNKTSKVVPVRVEIREVSAREGKAWQTKQDNAFAKILSKVTKDEKSPTRRKRKHPSAPR